MKKIEKIGSVNHGNEYLYKMIAQTGLVPAVFREWGL